MPQTTTPVQKFPSKGRFAVALHGGAGNRRLSEEVKQARLKSLATAIEAARDMLLQGATAVEVVEQTVRILEDNPLFNAGRGAVFNSAGAHELDAAIMDGSSRQAGAVAGVQTVRNPISLARLVMTETSHVLLIGNGAEDFADQMHARPQIERVANDYFSTESRRLEWQQYLERERSGQPLENYRGTVGCVALDQHGNLSAGTSTGGMTNKKYGRVGDTPLVGAGTYADNATCAVSCTGTGELFIRECIAFRVAALMAYRQLSLEAAVRHVIDDVLPADAGGLIAVDRTGQISMHMNTVGMSRACADSAGRLEVSL